MAKHDSNIKLSIIFKYEHVYMFAVFDARVGSNDQNVRQAK